MHVSETNVKSVYDATLQLMIGITEYFFKQKSVINEIIFVPISILLEFCGRMMRSHCFSKTSTTLKPLFLF
jgi:hypothetical protein